MKGVDVLKLRDEKGWSQQELAELLNGLLDRKYGSPTISGWESGKRPVPATVEAALAALIVQENLGDMGVVNDTPENPPDIAPSGEEFTPQPVVGVSGVYAKACEELWSMIAMTLGMTGAVLGSDKLINDGKIIEGDKKALGVAYGKLAETNETFRRMLTGMTSGGAWVEVTMVTGTTVAKLWQNHSTGGVIVNIPGSDSEHPQNEATAA